MFYFCRCFYILLLRPWLPIEVTLVTRGGGRAPGVALNSRWMFPSKVKHLYRSAVLVFAANRAHVTRHSCSSKVSQDVSQVVSQDLLSNEYFGEQRNDIAMLSRRPHGFGHIWLHNIHNTHVAQDLTRLDLAAVGDCINATLDWKIIHLRYLH